MNPAGTTRPDPDHKHHGHCGFRDLYPDQYREVAAAIVRNARQRDEPWAGSLAEDRRAGIHQDTHLARALLDPLFSSVRSARQCSSATPEAGRRDAVTGLTWIRWHHRAKDALAEDIACLAIDGDALRDGVSAYLRNPGLRSDYLDWFCADALTYHEYYVTCGLIQAQLQGRITTALIRRGGSSRTLGYALRSGGQMIKWATWFATLVVSALASKVAMGVMLVLTAAYLVLRWQRRRQTACLLRAMADAYQVFGTERIDWDMAWFTLNKARDLGAVWPGELYRLVEARRHEGRIELPLPDGAGLLSA